MNGSADSIAPLHEMRATFASAAQMQDAVSKLSRSGFDRADLSLPSPELVHGTETPEAGTKPASTEADARQSRTLGASYRGRRCGFGGGRDHHSDRRGRGACYRGGGCGRRSGRWVRLRSSRISE